MDKDWDALLDDGMLRVPADFTASVMRQVRHLPRPGWAERLQNLALIGGGILGLTQLAAFMFGLWAASTAG